MCVDLSAMVRDNRQISIRMEQLAGQMLATQGLTGIQAQILRAILQRGDAGTSLTRLHRETGYSMAALSALIKRLREKGYVRAEPCAQDDRRKQLCGTEAGFCLQRTLDASFQRLEARLCQGFSQEELETMARLQRRLLQTLNGICQTAPKGETNL